MVLRRALRRFLFATVVVSAVLPVRAANTESDAGEQSTPAPTPETPWNVWENKALSTTLIVSALFDVATFQQDDRNIAQVRNVPTKGEWRAERVVFAGALKFPRPWIYVIGANFNGIEADRGDKFTWMDIRLDIPLPRVGKMKIGRQKVGVSQEWLMPGLDWIFMERSSMNNSFAPQRSEGVLLQNTFASDRGVWSVGWFNDWWGAGRSFSQGGDLFSLRLSFLPIERDDGEKLLQVAANGFYRQSIDGRMQFRSRPEVNQSPFFLDTTPFLADHSVTSQFELMAINGPLQVFGELALTPVSAPHAGNPFFYGTYAGASYFLTGEHRSFNRREGYYGPFVPKTPFGFPHGGRGAWEISGRYSFADLTGGAVSGGTLARWTGAVAWYPTSRWRFEFNYGHGILDRDGTRGHFNVYQTRVQWSM